MLQMDIWNLRLSADGGHVAIGGRQGVSLWDVKTGKLCWHVEEGRKAILAGFVKGFWRVNSVGFSPDGTRVVVAGSREQALGGILMIDVASGKMTPRFTSPKNAPLGTVSFTADGDMLFGVCTGGIRFWDAKTGKTRFTLTD
jgi:WD40 repeat protein